MSPPLTAYWNTVTAAVWVEGSSKGDVIAAFEKVLDEPGAYDVLAGAGFSRRANWLIVPGVPHLRSLDVSRTAV